MSNSKKILIGVLTLVLIIGIYGFSGYNRFVSANEAVTNQWAQVEAQYQRRFDLIPNLVESVKGVMKQEQKVFGDIADARTRYAGASTVDGKAQAASQLESAVARLLVIVENYPQLKSSEAVQTLMAQLEGTENRVSVERQRFNDSVRSLNVMVKSFPSSVIAKMFGFSERSYFEAAPAAANAPQVKF